MLNWFTSLILLVDWVIIIALGIRIIMSRRSVGATLSWMLIIVTFPLVGAIIYLLVGENRLGVRRSAKAQALYQPYRDRLLRETRGAPIDWESVHEAASAISRQGTSVIGIPPIAGNELRLLDDCETILQAIIADIDRAQSSCHMEFYIWYEGGTGDDVAEALIQARRRGVACRVLLDAVGSRRFLAGEQAERMRRAGVELVAALPVALWRTLFVRLDLRLHRKIVVIDSQVAYTGSLNLADSRFFKRNAGMGHWVDAMARVRGPVVHALALLFHFDWELETGLGVDALGDTDPAGESSYPGGSIVLAAPSGPGPTPMAIHHMLLTTLYAARKELVITTPYFVPDDVLVTALVSAAQRGVRVTLVVPEKIDSVLVRLASRSHYDDLLSAGVQIMHFQQGLLHTKTITLDGEISLIGSVNMDMRSFFLNFEITLFVFDADFTAKIREMQEEYIRHSLPIDLETWRQRPFRQRLASNAAQLLGPLL